MTSLTIHKKTQDPSQRTLCFYLAGLFVGISFGNQVIKGLYHITFYFLIGYFYEAVTVQLSFKEQIIAHLTWYGASAGGGILGGVVGFFVKKSPYVLFILLLGLILHDEGDY